MLSFLIYLLISGHIRGQGFGHFGQGGQYTGFGQLGFFATGQDAGLGGFGEGEHVDELLVFVDVFVRVVVGTIGGVDATTVVNGTEEQDDAFVVGIFCAPTD